MRQSSESRCRSSQVPPLISEDNGPNVSSHFSKTNTEKKSQSLRHSRLGIGVCAQGTDRATQTARYLQSWPYFTSKDVSSHLLTNLIVDNDLKHSLIRRSDSMKKRWILCLKRSTYRLHVFELQRWNQFVSAFFADHQSEWKTSKEWHGGQTCHDKGQRDTHKPNSKPLSRSFDYGKQMLKGLWAYHSHHSAASWPPSAPVAFTPMNDFPIISATKSGTRTRWAVPIRQSSRFLLLQAGPDLLESPSNHTVTNQAATSKRGQSQADVSQPFSHSAAVCHSTTSFSFRNKLHPGSECLSWRSSCRIYENGGLSVLWVMYGLKP